MGRLTSLSSTKAVPENVLFEALDVEDKEPLVVLTVRVGAKDAGYLEKLLRHPSMTGSRSGAIRWCLHQGLTRIAETLHADDTVERLNVAYAISEVQRKQRLYSSYETSIADMHRTLDWFVANGMTEAAQASWQEMRQIVEGLRDPWWKARYMAVLNEEQYREVREWRPPGPRGIVG